MKANELMIGDWVFIEDDENPDGLSYTKVVYLTKDNTEWLHPIHLTEEILKVNGFTQEETSFHLSCAGLKLHIKKCNNDYKLKAVKYEKVIKGKGYTNSRRWRIPEITYVHELQHALRICGLNEIADNLMIYQV